MIGMRSYNVQRTGILLSSAEDPAGVAQGTLHLCQLCFEWLGVAQEEGWTPR